MNTRVHLILYTIIVLEKLDLFICIPTAGAIVECVNDCFDWQYCRQEDGECIDCSRCGNGQGAYILCTQFNDTVCKPCPSGMFSALSVEHYAYLCFPCTKCGPDRDTIANCTVETDTSCGPCPRRMFAYGNGTCLECSQCPDDPSIQATRYTECAVNGAPRNYMCLPGTCTDCKEHNVTVNMSEGGWVTYKPDDIVFDGETEPTTESTTLAAAMSITVGTIVGLLVIFVGAFCVWLLYGIYCKGARRGQRWRHSNNDESAMQLMDAEETTREGNTSSPTLVVRGSAATVQYVVRKSVPSLKLLEVIGFIKEVEHKWSAVAEALGMTKDAIDKINCTCNGNTTECCRKMLDKSLRSADSASWVNIIKACKGNFLHSVAAKLELFFTSDETFCESDVVLWDHFVYQIKRESQKLPVIPKWCSQLNSALLQLNVIVQGKAYTLEDAIIKLRNEEGLQAIALVGEAGAGKTTMALQLVQNWCMIGSNSQFALVIYINITRTDLDKITDLSSFISVLLETPIDGEMVEGMCKILEKQRGRGLLVMLDGYDEMAQDSVSNVFIQESLRSSFPEASLLYICRPGYVISVDYSIEVPLLRCDQMEHYIQETVGRRGNALQCTPIWPMMHNPLLLTIACQLVCLNMDVTSLNTLSRLYHTLVIKLLSDQVREISYSDQDRSATVRSVLSLYARASYNAMVQSQHYITSVDNVDSILASGLLVKHRNTLYFTHYSFLQFFAAYHLANSSLDFDLNALKVNHGDSLLFPFLSGLTGKISRYKTAETNLISASVCYLEAKSPVSGQENSVVDTSILLNPLVLNNHLNTPHQLHSLTVFMQECEGVEELTLNEFTSNARLNRENPIINTSDAVSNNVICFQGEILVIFNSKYLKRINATSINITDKEWVAVADAMKINTSIVMLDLSHNTIANDDIITGISISLTVNDHLQTLLLSNCELTSHHADKLIKSLSSNICLLQIDLSNNLIEQLNIKIIKEVLQREIIQEINVANNPIAEEIQSQLVEIVHQDQKIKL